MRINKKLFAQKKLHRKYVIVSKSSHRRCSTKRAHLKNFAIFKGKHLSWSLLLIKFPCDFIKKRIQLNCISLNIAKFLRTPTLKKICERVLLRVLRPTSCHYSLSIPSENIK